MSSRSPQACFGRVLGVPAPKARPQAAAQIRRHREAAAEARPTRPRMDPPSSTTMPASLPKAARRTTNQAKLLLAHFEQNQKNCALPLLRVLSNWSHSVHYLASSLVLPCPLGPLPWLLPVHTPSLSWMSPPRGVLVVLPKPVLCFV